MFNLNLIMIKICVFHNINNLQGNRGDYRIAQNFGGGIFWRIWQILLQLPKFYHQNFCLFSQLNGVA